MGLDQGPGSGRLAESVGINTVGLYHSKSGLSEKFYIIIILNKQGHWTP